MKEIFRFVFDKITDPLSLPIYPLWEWLILGIIGITAYKFAFSKVENMYHSGFISGSFLGSLFHWIIRLVVFVFLWAIVYCFVFIIQWSVAHWIASAIIAFCIVIFVISIRAAYNSIKIKQKNDLKQ